MSTQKKGLAIAKPLFNILFKFLMLEKEEKQVREECPGHSGQLRPKHNSPSILEGVPLGGVVILNIRIPCEKMPLTTICESKITLSITS